MTPRMTPGPCPLRLYTDPGAVWIGVQVLDSWIVFQPFPCVGVCWKRR